MKNNKFKIILTIVALTIIITVVNVFGPSDNEIRTQAYKSLRFVVYRGVVSEKFNDKNNHDYPTLKLINENGIQTIQLPLEISGFFNFVQKNDSIIKEYGSYIVKVYRNNELYNFKLDYGINN